ncbi:MAG: hypothetical protein JKY52_20350, partial [Flavobacteriales bacterium]|nr:hypothetical protein [Flavobacteriales bacterium]
DVEEEHLPTELRAMPSAEREEYVAAKVEQRKKLEAEIVTLDKKRDEYLAKEMKGDEAKVKNSFNSQIFNTLKRQTHSKKYRMSSPKF